jgi:hypothetical protein
MYGYSDFGAGPCLSPIFVIKLHHTTLFALYLRPSLASLLTYTTILDRHYVDPISAVRYAKRTLITTSKSIVFGQICNVAAAIIA